MLKHIIRLLAIVAVISILLVDCTTSVSGVETGNPKMSTFARIALELFNNNDEWLPSSYLVNGITQLDPSIISNKPIYADALPKRSADVEVSEVADSGSYLLVERTDTVITNSAIVVVDTIVNNYIKIDTLIDSEWIENSLDSVMVISKKLFTDSIFIIDTVMIIDTFIRQRYDTIYKDIITNKYTIEKNGAVVSLPSLSPINVVAYYGLSGAYLRVTGNSFSFDQQAQYQTISNNSLMCISRKSNIAGVSALEEYFDADGDGILIAIDGLSSSSLILNASYVMDMYNLDLNVTFDAGNDNSFANTNDNRIHSLKRSRKLNGSITEDVIYGTGQLSSTTDTLVLIKNKALQSDSVSNIVTKYYCIPGSDIIDHRQNRLSRLVHTVKFRSGNVKSIKITLTLCSLLCVAQLPSVAIIEAFIDYGKGNAGIFNGKVDYKDKVVYGIYAEGGIEYDYWYNYGNDSFTSEPMD